MPLTHQKCLPLWPHGSLSHWTRWSLGLVSTFPGRPGSSIQSVALCWALVSSWFLGRRASPCLCELSVTALRCFLQGTGGSFGSGGRSDLSFFTKQLCKSKAWPRGQRLMAKQQGTGHTSHKQDRLRKAGRDHPRRGQSRLFQVMCVSCSFRSKSLLRRAPFTNEHVSPSQWRWLTICASQRKWGALRLQVCLSPLGVEEGRSQDVCGKEGVCSAGGNVSCCSPLPWGWGRQDAPLMSKGCCAPREGCDDWLSHFGFSAV